MDYHKNFENYYKAKKILFSMCKKAIVNTDDDYGKRLFDEIKCDKVSFGIDSTANIMASSIDITDKGVTFFNNDEKFSVKIPGKFSVYNALAGVAVGHELECNINSINEGFGKKREF